MPDTKTVQHIGFDQPITINVDDFDPAVHREIDETGKAPKGRKAAKD